jgi:ligand-binding sensor domain-containing protein/signal transduction histidine kinase
MAGFQGTYVGNYCTATTLCTLTGTMQKNDFYVKPLIHYARIIFLYSVLLLTVLTATETYAQRPQLTFRRLSNANGLSQNHVFSITQDKQGFMWFGTSEGLNRFDGYTFTIYNHSRYDSTSICHDNASCLIEDRSGQLWVGTGGGLSQYVRATNSFRSYVFRPDNPDGISEGAVNEVYEDSKGNLWLAFATGVVDILDRKTDKFIHFPIFKDGFAAQNTIEATGILEDREGNIWIATNKGLLVMKDRKIIRHYQHNPSDPASLSHNGVNDLFLDSKGNVWAATDYGVSRYDQATDSFVRAVHEENNPNSLSIDVVKFLNEDREGRLWIATENGGLNVWDRSANQFYHFKENDSDKTSLSDNSIYHLYRDRLDNMWVGTNSKGVAFYDRFVKPFVVYQSSPGVPFGISHNKVVATAEQPGKGYWIATDGGGLNFYDDKKNTFIAYKHTEGNRNGMTSNYVVDVKWDAHEACLWIATWGGGLVRLDPEKMKFTAYRHDPKDPTSIAHDNLWYLHLDSAGVLYIGTIGRGACIFNKQKGTFENYGTQHGLREKNVVSLYRDSKNYLWIGSWGSGASRMDLTTRKFVPLPRDFKLNSCLFTNEDSLKRIWISGNTGIVCYDPKADTIFTFTHDDGLPGSIVNAMSDDQKGHYWLSTNKGIVKFNPQTKDLKVYSVEDGLPTNQFTSRILRAADGRMFFSSVDGLVVFHPDSIHSNPNIPVVILTELKIFNKTVIAGGKENILQEHISETKEIWLPAAYNFITLNFVALNFTSSYRNQYAYKLEGFDQDWIQVGNQRSATYTSLDEGRYVFRVKASNNDGVWNEEGATLIIHVMPPWWQAAWFKGLLALSGALAIIAFYRLRIRAVKIQNKKLSQLVLDRTTELHKLNHEIHEQNVVLKEHEEELAQKNYILLQRQEEIEAQNEELKQSQEEIATQRDIVYAQNHKLEEAQETIKKQNESIQRRNENLEQEVEARTQELVAYNQQLEQFAFISAHNLRAPVARILGLGKILELSPKDSEDKRSIYEKMVFTARELDRVVRDLNTILEVKKNNTSVLSEIRFDETLTLVKLHTEKEIQETFCDIQADFSRAPRLFSVKPYVESIMLNLISNAIKYRHPNRRPVIQIQSEPYNEYIRLTVSDNGLGIDTTLYKEKIFTLYQRFHNHVEGKGLGLYLIKTQIVALGGKIEIESEVDEGTTFKVYFKKNPEIGKSGKPEEGQSI